jgi:hypothetical protein
MYMSPLCALASSENIVNDMYYREMLLTVMDVFVKEPQLDWVTAAKAQTGNSESKQSMSLTQGDVSWYPLQKLKIARV